MPPASTEKQSLVGLFWTAETKPTLTQEGFKMQYIPPHTNTENLRWGDFVFGYI